MEELSCQSTYVTHSHVRVVDSQLDQLQLPEVNATSGAVQNAGITENIHDQHWAQVDQLRASIKSLSTASASRILLHPTTLRDILRVTQHSQATESATLGLHHDIVGEKSPQLQELEWLLVSKVTAQTYGLILNVLLEQIIPLSGDIWYWDEVLGTYANTGLYTVQSSPHVFWKWSQEVYRDARQRLQSIHGESDQQSQMSLSLSDRWARFYGLVKDSMREHSLANVQSKILSPLTVCRTEVKFKQRQLKRLREMSASSLGILMNEALMFETDDEVSVHSDTTSQAREEWRTVVSKSIALMETVLRNVTQIELGSSEFEDTVFEHFMDDPETAQQEATSLQLPSDPAKLAKRLEELLGTHLPTHISTARTIVQQHGKPSLIVRYWIPGLLLFLSSSTLLRLFFNRKTEIKMWIQDLGTTTQDFWYNWVVEPLKRVIATIRHDEDSEVALMSKGSLEGDRASLERMVVEFAKDNPPNGTVLSDAEVAEIRVKVKEGDLTPVLKAYEKDLRKPFAGAIRGDLIRALLIQTQKTKVDIEVAVSGIDALLKSQELVFG